MTRKMFTRPSGIYQIRNLINGKIYIGQSCRLVDRRYGHFRLLSLNKEHTPHLQSSYNKYGKDAFVFEVLLYCEIDELDYYEQIFVDKLHPEYNVRKTVTSNRGHFMSDETKQKISASNKGKIRSEEQRRRIGESHKGIKRSNEFRKQQSERMLGGGGFHPISNLSIEDVKEIRRLGKESNLLQKNIADLFGVDRITIYNICTYRTWRHVA